MNTNNNLVGWAVPTDHILVCTAHPTNYRHSLRISPSNIQNLKMNKNGGGFIHMNQELRVMRDSDLEASMV